ncbi:MAG: DEAD/DEAH box helicase, partial [Anaerolineae bacterium]|nr:DEAD/DEAH box helicase [Anaerolineae bacterium]
MSARPGPGLLSHALTPEQASLVEAPVGEPQSLFLEGPAGSGKTTAAVCRLLRLLAEGVPADSILVLVPQRTLGRPYLEALQSSQAPPGARVDVLTIGGLAQRSVELYWPLVAGPAGFARPDRPPVFLTLETAQYYMDRLVEPYIQQGAFGEVTLSRQRLISQILDGLNKAAVARFPHQEIGPRLSQAWKGESSRLRVYERVQACASDFRRYCLERNLLDFSLQIEVFACYVLALPVAAAALRQRFQHILADNVEEDVPIAHDLLADWLPQCESAWVIYDQQGGLRTYLGADPASAYALR